MFLHCIGPSNANKKKKSKDKNKGSEEPVESGINEIELIKIVDNLQTFASIASNLSSTENNFSLSLFIHAVYYGALTFLLGFTAVETKLSEELK